MRAQGLQVLNHSTISKRTNTPTRSYSSGSIHSSNSCDVERDTGCVVSTVRSPILLRGRSFSSDSSSYEKEGNDMTLKQTAYVTFNHENTSTCYSNISKTEMRMLRLSEILGVKINFRNRELVRVTTLKETDTNVN